MSTDSSSPNSNSRFSEFLADYFIECDEHLAIARRSLLALESLLPQSTTDRATLDELFRSFHSLKGLSAMVGFQQAEQLAHHLESLLLAVRKDQIQLDLVGIEVLMEGVVTLEQEIASRRDLATSPDISPLMRRLASLLSGAATTESLEPDKIVANQSPSAQRDTMIAQSMMQGGKAWRVVFSPSSELAEQGIDVNSTRQKLREIGDIIHSEPLIGDAGKIEFSFMVVTQSADDAVLGLQGNGLTCIPYLPTAAPDEASDMDRDLPETAEMERLSTHLTPANVVRVNLERIDELMRLVGELVVSRARLDDGLRRLDSSAPAMEMRLLRETSSAIERQLRDLREGVMRVRMVSVREVFARMQFVVRDLMRDLGKQVELYQSGEETQIDKYVVERLMDPLLHLVRNAVSHGLESPAERLAAGKPAAGQLYLRAGAKGELIEIVVEDDGRGIDFNEVLSRAQSRGFVSAQTPVESVSLLDLLCIPGFSTRERSDRVSGRGIGMDVVRNSVEELGGSLALYTTPGQGTRFEIQLPLTLAITDALIVKVGAQRYAVPQVAIREIIRIEPGSSSFIENNELLRHREGILPLLRLSQLLGMPADDDTAGYVLVIGEGSQAIGITVNRVLGLREIVVRPLTDRLVKVSYLAGATELGDGQVVLILDAAHLTRRARARTTPLSTTDSGHVFSAPHAEKEHVS